MASFGSRRTALWLGWELRSYVSAWALYGIGALALILLALKPQLRAFAGGLTQQEVRSTLLLGLLGFVIWPLLPDRFVDPWQLLQPRED
jgi:uncharacterized membrane protein (DUF4010 family)